MTAASKLRYPISDDALKVCWSACLSGFPARLLGFARLLPPSHPHSLPYTSIHTRVPRPALSYPPPHPTLPQPTHPPTLQRLLAAAQSRLPENKGPAVQALLYGLVQMRQVAGGEGEH